VMDATETERMLGLAPTPWEVALPTTVQWYRSK
jgi:hypothetical protein